MPSFRTTLIITAAFLAGTHAFAVDTVVGIEAGYGLITSSTDLSPAAGSGALSSLYFGYLIHDEPTRLTLLSLATGYELFPQAVGTTALHRLVYGLEYHHLFRRDRPVSVVADYGLLFNLLLQTDREGYAFGHHTRLAAGALLWLNERSGLLAKVSYNIATFPYFEISDSRVSYPAISLRYVLFR